MCVGAELGAPARLALALHTIVSPLHIIAHSAHLAAVFAAFMTADLGAPALALIVLAYVHSPTLFAAALLAIVGTDLGAPAPQ